MIREVSLIAVASACFSLANTPSQAASQETLERQIEALQRAIEGQQAQLDAQKQQLQAQRAEIEALRARAAQQQAAPAAEVAKEQQQLDQLQQVVTQAKIAAQDQPKWSFANNRPTITSADGRSSLSLRANVQLDAGHYDQKRQGTLASDFRRGSIGGTGNRETNAAQDLSDGAYFRRARFGAEGVIARDFNYRLLLELGGAGTEGPTRINDAWISYTGLAPFSIQLGAFSPPANLDDSTTPEDLLFIERASSSELSRTLGGADGRIGLALRGNGSRWMNSLAFTTRTVNDAEVFDSQFAAVGRAGFLVATSPDYNVHLGLSGIYVFKPADQGSLGPPPRYGIRFRDRPEIRVDSTRLIDTGSIDAAHAYAAGAELATNWKSLYLQAEDYWFGIERRNPSTLRDPRFSGYYVQGSWIITGERHRYNMATASFQSPRPLIPFSSAGGVGAWELALRYSHTDLNDEAGVPGLAPPAHGVRGGVQNISTAGLNWYLNPNLRFLLDYLRVKINRLNPAGPGALTPFGAAPLTPPIGVQIGQDVNVYALRTQFNF